MCAHKEHENELFPRFIANLDVNEISIKFLTRPLFRCPFLPSIPASVLLKVTNGPQGLGRDYASLWMREEEEYDQVRKNMRRRKVCRLRRKTTKRAKRKLKDCYKGMDEDNRKEEEGKDQGWWLASPQ